MFYTLREKPDTDAKGVYQISNTAELYWFRDLVNGLLKDGTAQNSAAKAVLTSDISTGRAVDLGIGTSASPYSGTFDGKGHKLTVALTGERYVAPFAFVNGATIKNLTVDGTVTASGMNASGLISRIEGGEVKIEKCIIDIISSVEGDGTHGGFVGVLNKGTLNMNNCAFTGSISGEKTTNCGGFIGWAAQKATISNSYITATFAIKADKNSNTIARNPSKAKLSGVYYLNALGDTAPGAVQKSSSLLASGEVAYLMNKAQNAEVWFQTCGEGLPVFSGKKVYLVYDVEDAYYSNDNTINMEKGKHYAYKDHFCVMCGEGEPAVYNSEKTIAESIDSILNSKRRQPLLVCRACRRHA